MPHCALGFCRSPLIFVMRQKRASCNPCAPGQAIHGIAAVSIDFNPALRPGFLWPAKPAVAGAFGRLTRSHRRRLAARLCRRRWLRVKQKLS